MDNSIQADNFYGAISPIGHLLPSVNWTDPFYNANGYYDFANMSYMISAAVDPSHFILHCFFDKNYSHDCRAEWEQFLSPNGLCYTFNPNGTYKTKYSGSSYNLELKIDIHTDLYTWGMDSASGLQVRSTSDTFKADPSSYKTSTILF